VLIGYFRTRTDHDGTASAQRQALVDAGCTQLVEDLTSGRRWEQPELRRVLDELHPGDVVVVPQLDGLGRSLTEVVRRAQSVFAAGAGLRSLKEGIDTVANAGQAMVRLIGSLAELDRSAARDGINAGLAVAQAEGRRSGRRPKLTEQQRVLVADAVLSGRSTAAHMAREYKISAPTVSRVVAARRAKIDGSEKDRAVLEASRQDDKVVGVLPLSALNGRLAIVGTSGSGKTYAAKGLVELLMDGGRRVCIVDPLGVWWGLRAGADGGDAGGYPVVVFGGCHADIALDDGMGAALGRLLGTHPLACVVDLSELGSSGARRLFMTAFAKALHEANTEPLHLVLDEADLWAPQRAQPDGQALLGQIEEIVRRGRVRGFVPWLITQRPAVLHKDVLSQADILLSMKLTSSQDREAVGRWIEGQADRADGRRILAELPQLGRGEGTLWAPSDCVLKRVQFPLIRTFDSSRTPQRDESVATPRTLAAVDVSALAIALADMEAVTSDTDADPARSRRDPASGSHRRLKQMEGELAAARTRMAMMQARLEQAEGQDARAAAVGIAPRRRGAAATRPKTEP